MDNIILIGYMGSGKTTIANVISNQYGYKFCDTDYLIEKQSKMKISSIFEEKGEEYFRKLETRTLEQIQTQLNHTVLATGGGMPCREENAKLLRNIGTVVYLKVSKKEILKRLEGDKTRPLLQTNEVEQKIQDMLTLRDPLYQKAAHYVIDTDAMSAEEIAEKIVNINRR